MNMRQLEYFIAVAEEQNFSKAAARLFVTQPLLSKQVSMLEYEIGYKLFDRTTKGVTLTHRGKALLEGAKKLYNDMNDLALQARAPADDTTSGLVRVGLVRTACSQGVLHELDTFTARYPGIRLDLAYYSALSALDAIESGRIDLAFIHSPTYHKDVERNIIYQPIEEDALCLVAHQRDLTSGAFSEYLELARKKSIFLIENQVKGLYLIANLCADMGIEPDFHFVQDISMVRAYAEIGAGISVMPYSQFSSYRSEFLSAQKIPLPDARLCICCAWKCGDHSWPQDMLLQHITNISSRCDDCMNQHCKVRLFERERVES